MSNEIFEEAARILNDRGNKLNNEILEQAANILNERANDYGDANDCFSLIAEFWAAYTGMNISSSDVACMMILLKIARNKSGGYKEDNFVDIAGYAALMHKVAER